MEGSRGHYDILLPERLHLLTLDSQHVTYSCSCLQNGVREHSGAPTCLPHLHVTRFGSLQYGLVPVSSPTISAVLTITSQTRQKPQQGDCSDRHWDQREYAGRKGTAG